MENKKIKLSISGNPKKPVKKFETSNIQGKNTVASMVLFRDGYPSKKEYRRFKIQSVDKPDDFESMREVVQRRYSRLIKEKKDFPDLIIIDGGKGQLSASCEILKKLNIYNKINIIISKYLLDR